MSGVSKQSLRPAVFLDRDGTLNRQIVRDGKPFPPDTVDQFELFEDVPEGCKALAKAGYVLVVATNQPDVGRGTQSADVVHAMHERLQKLVPEITRVEVCFDPGRGEQSNRRKPEPGMLIDATAALNLDLSRSWMIGDRWRDVDCGKRAGVKTAFIDFGYTEDLREQPDVTVRSFAEAVQAILATP